MRVLHVLNSNSYSGAENVVIQIISKLQDEYEFAYCSPNGPIGEKLKECGIKYIPVDKLSIKSIKKVINEYKPDVIHAHDFRASLLVSFFNRSIPIISHLHNNCPWLSKPGVKSFAYYLAAKKASRILCVSDSVMDQYIFNKSFKKKVVVVGNPVDVLKVLSMASNNAKKYDIVFCGRLTEQKDPLRFVNIVKEVSRDICPFKVVMVGEGKLRPLIEQEIHNQDLSNTIEMTGFVNNSVSIMSCSKMLVMTSAWEGFGLVAIEALSLGLPVVSTKVGGLPYIVDDNCGKLCDSNQEFVDEIKYLLSNGDYYENKSKHALSKAKQLDNSVSYFKTIGDLYTELKEGTKQ